MSHRGEFGGSSESYGSNDRTSRLPVRPYYDDPSRGYQTSGYGSSGFQQLVEKVSGDIFTVTNNASALERASKQIGTSRDSHSLRDKIHTIQQKTNSIIAETANNFHRLTQLAASEKEKKLTVNRLRSQFEETLQRYNTLQKQAAEKAKSATLMPKAPTRQLDTAWQEDEAETEWANAQNQQHEEKKQLLEQEQAAIEDELAMFEEREDRVRQLEADILDINEIFRDLGTMVYEQREMVDNIEDNVYRASDHVEGGVQQLQKASSYQKSARKKMCILLIIILVVGGVLALILYFSLKK